MDTLFAPWRLVYLEGATKPASGCPFCGVPSLDAAGRAERQVLARRGDAFAMLNRYPYSNGHLMVIPTRHVADPAALSTAEWNDLTTLLRDSIGALGRAYQCDGVNAGMNIGRAAGAGIDQHIHFHAVPRWSGDVNFMTTVAGARVVVESLDATYQRLQPFFAPLENA